MASAEGGSLSSGMAYGEKCLLSSRLRGLGECRELPQRGPGQSPGRKRILAYFEGHRTSVVTDSEFASESANFSSIRPSPSPRIFGGRK